MDTRIPKSDAATYLSTPAISVCVGDEDDGKKTFTVHEGLITARSLFFRNALNGNWRESDDKSVPLDDVDPEIFAIYLNSIYHNQLPVFPASGEVDGGGQFETLMKVYVLADKLMDTTTKNTILDAVICRVRERKIPSPAALTIVYVSTPENDPMRRLVVDVCAQWGSIDSFANERPPADFMYDLLVAMRKMHPSTSPTERALAGLNPAHYRIKEGGSGEVKG
ncbi:hypothetical protein B0J11DRAFT_573932 [Dendryphion nanum]|uniref:BTB domain-containing protein n=1 Tax=Dendryphion nanum TaxID=256645 RepID=A0A9P9EI93_9PLEO|nr:hypothetical protein B0J11DRAFT_573932 [Dendryphion nanum]